MDDAKGHIQEQTLPQLQKMDGFKGFVALGDRQSGKVLGVALWESEEALRATEEAVSSQRSGVAEAAGATVAGVESYEVAVFEVPSAGPISGVTDAVGGVTQPVSGVTDTVGGVTGSVSGVTDNLLGGGGEKQR
jgi:heme-degrading monooxygenase HmoA